MVLGTFGEDSARARESRYSDPFFPLRNTMQQGPVKRQQTQIVQSQLNLRDFLCAPWKGALSLRVRIPPGNCRSSR